VSKSSGGRQSPNGGNSKPTKDGGDGRDEGGRFTKGNPGGPGNRHATMARKYKAEIYRCISPADLAKQAHKVKRIAESGERWAIELCWSYLLGKPAQAVNISGSLEFSFADAMGELRGVRRVATSRT